MSRFWLTGLLIVLASALIALFVVRNVSPAELSENYLSDLRIAQFSQPRQASRDIAVVLIDETSLQNLPYRSPLDRGLLASLITDKSI